MKTGTLTWHFLNNYGSVLQTYALQHTLSHIPGIENEVIAYRNVVHQSLIQAVLSYCKKNGLVNTLKACIQYPFKRFCRKQLVFPSEDFDKFRSRYVLCSSKSYNSDTVNSVVDEYDAFIVGSDNVWITQPETGEPRGLSDRHYFLDFVPSSKIRISYAASMGNPEISDEGRENFRQLFTTIDYISVRERKTAETISSIIGRDVAWVVDPTLLLDADEWNKIEAASENALEPNSYILVYVIYELADSAAIFQYAKYLSSLLKKKIVYLGYHKEEGEIKNTYVPVPDFLYLINHASYIITNSFHGTVFSIIYRKSFAAFPPRDGATRITDTLESFHLSDRYATTLEDAKKMPLNLDYTKINHYIEERRAYSKEWLLTALTPNKLGKEQ